MKLTYYGIPTPVVSPKQNLLDVFTQAYEDLRSQGEVPALQSGDIIGVASKVVAMEQGRLVDLRSVTPSPRAITFAKETSLSPEFVEVVLGEADEVIGTVHGALLTLRQGDLQANAGVDKSNAGPNQAILLPDDPSGFSARFKSHLEQEMGLQNLGVMVIDSCTRPLRLGTMGMGLGAAGFPMVVDDRGLDDLFGKKMEITYRAVGDNLASACNLLMGESAEATPFVLVRGLAELGQRYGWGERQGKDPRIAPDRCLYFKNFVVRSI